MSASSGVNSLWESFSMSPCREVSIAAKGRDPSLVLMQIFKDVIGKNCRITDVERRPLIEANLELVFWGISEEPSLYRSFSLRVDFAEIATQSKPDFFAHRLLQFFSESELANPSKHSDRLAQIIRKLTEAVSSEDSYYQKTKLYIDSYSKRPNLRLRGIAVMALYHDPDFEKSMDTPKWRYIGKIKTSAGINRIFKLDWDFDETFYRRVGGGKEGIGGDLGFHQIALHHKELTAITYPAIIEGHLGCAHKCWWGSVLGYEGEEGFNGRFITLPEPAAILENWKKVLRHPLCPGGIYTDLKIHAVPEGTLSTPHFLRSFFEYDVIISMTKEYVHDHTIHLIRTINVIMTSKEEEYLQSLEKMRTYLKKGLEALRRARDEKVEEDALLNLLELCLGMFADVYLSLETIENRNYLLDEYECSRTHLKIKLEQSSMGRWWPAFGKMGGEIDRYTIDDVQLAWNRVILRE